MFLFNQGCSLGNLELQSHRQKTLATSLTRGPGKQRNEKKGARRCVEVARNDFSSELLSCSRSINVSALSQGNKTATSQKKEITPNHNNRMATPSKTISGQSHPGRATMLRSRRRLLTIGKTRQHKWPRQATHRALMRAWQGIWKTIAPATHTHHSKYMPSAA